MVERPDLGYVRVDERAGASPEHRLFAEVLIPEEKRPTYWYKYHLDDLGALSDQAFPRFLGLA
jgi:RimJ/RimL family protein N-acetyltransferase